MVFSPLVIVSRLARVAARGAMISELVGHASLAARIGFTSLISSASCARGRHHSQKIAR